MLPQGVALAYLSPTIDNQGLFTYESIAPTSVVQTSGAYTERIPINLPPGRNGLQPDLALTYNSQELSDGPVGYGWSLSIPYIERMNKLGSERMYTDNYFSSSFVGELASTTILSLGGGESLLGGGGGGELALAESTPRPR